MNFAGTPNWQPGVLEAKTGPVSYTVRLADGRVWRRLATTWVNWRVRERSLINGANCSNPCCYLSHHQTAQHQPRKSDPRRQEQLILTPKCAVTQMDSLLLGPVTLVQCVSGDRRMDCMFEMNCANVELE